ncbi:hypothetical protein B0E37_04516 [Streptomyces sp. MH192]|nr:hypothetical protein [Streptomyces sp. MH192]MCF0101495.1 hypothetical protein [Streptomyces sp. MH191]
MDRTPKATPTAPRRTPAVPTLVSTALTFLHGLAGVVGLTMGTTVALRGAALLPALVCVLRLVLLPRLRRSRRHPVAAAPRDVGVWRM